MKRRCTLCDRDLPESDSTHIVFAVTNTSGGQELPVCWPCIKSHKLKPTKMVRARIM